MDTTTTAAIASIICVVVGGLTLMLIHDIVVTFAYKRKRAHHLYVKKPRTFFG